MNCSSARSGEFSDDACCLYFGIRFFFDSVIFDECERVRREGGRSRGVRSRIMTSL